MHAGSAVKACGVPDTVSALNLFPGRWISGIAGLCRSIMTDKCEGSNSGTSVPARGLALSPLPMAPLRASDPSRQLPWPVGTIRVPHITCFLQGWPASNRMGATPRVHAGWPSDSTTESRIRCPSCSRSCHVISSHCWRVWEPPPCGACARVHNGVHRSAEEPRQLASPPNCCLRCVLLRRVHLRCLK